MNRQTLHRTPWRVIILCLCAFWPAYDGEAASALTEYGGVQGFRVLETEHFRILYKKTPEPASLMAEKVWALLAKEVAGLADLWAAPAPAGPPVEVPAKEKKQPAAPQKKGPGPRQIIVLAESNADFLAIGTWHARTNLDRTYTNGFLAVLQKSASFDILEGQALVFDTYRSKHDRYRNMFFSHCLTRCILKRAFATWTIPIWLDGGLGYQTEFVFFQESATHYLDYDGYAAEYEGGEAQVWVREAPKFKTGTGWAGLIKNLMAQKGGKGNLRKVLAVREPTQLHPDTVAYMYSLGAFLTTGPGRNQKLALLLEKYRNNGSASEDEVVQACGFKSLEDMQKAWHAFILSGNFK